MCVSAILGGISSIASIDQSIKSDEARRRQEGVLEEEQEKEKVAIAEEKATALDTRKKKIDIQRKQLKGAGDYSLSSTGSTGSLTEELG